MPRRTARRNHQRLATEFERLGRDTAALLELQQRHVTGRQQAPVDAAEIDHHAIVGTRHFVGQGIGLAAFEAVVAERIGGEHQLRGKAKRIEGAWAILADESAERLVVAPQQDRLLGAGAKLGVAMQRLHAPHPLGLASLHERFKGGAPACRKVLADRVRKFHHVRIGVVNGAIFDIGHGRSPNRAPRLPHTAVSPVRRVPGSVGKSRPD